MRPNWRIALLVVFYFATVVRAEGDAGCCYCGRFFKVSDKGSGFDRNYVGLCPDCKKEFGDVDGALDKLRGQLRGLNDAAKLTLDRLKEALDKRDKARDGIFGIDGSAVKVFKSLMKFAAEGGGGTFGEIGKYADKGVDYYSKLHDVMEGDYQWVVDDGKDWLKDKTFEKVALKGAAGLARKHFAETGDAGASTRIFLDRHAQLAKGLSILDEA